MKRLVRLVGILVRVLGALVSTAMAVFCGFGFLDSFEPGNGILWKVGYGTLACGFLAGAVFLVWGGFRECGMRGAERGMVMRHDSGVRNDD